MGLAQRVRMELRFCVAVWAPIAGGMNHMFVVFLATSEEHAVDPLIGWRYLKQRRCHGCRLTLAITCAPQAGATLATLQGA